MRVRRWARGAGPADRAGPARGEYRQRGVWCTGSAATSPSWTRPARRRRATQAPGRRRGCARRLLPRAAVADPPSLRHPARLLQGRRNRRRRDQSLSGQLSLSGRSLCGRSGAVPATYGWQSGRPARLAARLQRHDGGVGQATPAPVRSRAASGGHQQGGEQDHPDRPEQRGDGQQPGASVVALTDGDTVSAGQQQHHREQGRSSR